MPDIMLKIKLKSYEGKKKERVLFNILKNIHCSKAFCKRNCWKAFIPCFDIL